MVVYAVFSVLDGGVISNITGISLRDFLSRKIKRRIYMRRITIAVNMRMGKNDSGLRRTTFNNPLLEWGNLAVKLFHK